jgi:xylulokinase
MEGKLNPYARGVFYGLCMGHTKYHIYRAILEGIAYHLRLCWENIQKANNAKDSSLIVTSGGGAKSKIWRQILADVFNTRVGRLNELETSTLGLACLTSVALGRHKRFEDVASQVKNTVIDVIEPIPENHAVYSRYYEDYKDLELSLESFFKPKNM